MRKKIRVACAAVLGVGAGALGTSPAQAQTTMPCSTLISADTAFTGTPATVYIAGSTASQIPLEALAPVVAAKNIAIVYQSPDSCQGVNDLLNHTAESSQAYNFLDPAQLTNGLAKAVTCTAPSPAPPIDIAPSDVYPDTCATNLNIGTVGSITTSSTTFRDFLGPIQAMTFVVPSSSTATSISSEAAYVVFGYDAMTYTVAPWSQSSVIFTRPNTSGTLNMLANAIGLAPTKFANATPPATGTTAPAEQEHGTGNMQTALVTAGAGANAAAAIGQLSYEAVESYSGAANLKILAFQHTGQSCGYLPGSDATHPDMINVRQGRYAVWGPLHFIVNVDASGNPLGGSMTANPAVVTLLNYFLATGPTPPASSTADGGASPTDIKTLITAEAKPAYVVPWCAMQVTRTSEIGQPMSYQPSEPCGCYYESVLGVNTSTYCKTCTDNSGCSAPYPTCRYGYCEAQ